MSQNMEQDLLFGFISEMRGHVSQIIAILEATSRTMPDEEKLAGIRSAAHSVKGGGSMAGFAALSHVAYLVEKTADELRSRELDWTSEVRDFLLMAAGSAVTILEQVSAGRYDDRGGLAKVVKAHRILHGRAQTGIEAELDNILGAQEEVPLRTQFPDAEEEAVPAEVLQVFWQEMDELLHQISESLQAYSRSPENRQDLLEARRGVHTLKGAAASMGFPDCSLLAHRMEDVFDAIKEGAIPYDTQASSLLYACFDGLTDTAGSPEDLSVPKRALAQVDSRFAALLKQASDAKPRGPKNSEDEAEELPADLLDAFRAEAEEQVQHIAGNLQRLEAQPGNRSLLLEVRRAIHTLKGPSNMIRRRSMAELAHSAEDLLEACHEGTPPWSPQIAGMVEETCDLLLEMAGAQSGYVAASSKAKELQSRLAALVPEREERTAAPAEARSEMKIPSALESIQDLEAKPVSSQGAGKVSAGFEVERGDSGKSSHFVRVPIEKLDELVRLVGEMLVNRSTLEQWRNGYAHSVEELGLSNTRLNRVSGRLDHEYEVSALGGGMGQLAIRGVVTERTERRQEFDDLEFDRYTDFHLFSRDLSELSSDVNSATSDLRQRVSDFDTRTHRLGRLLSELQDKLMRMRMVPLSTLAHRMQRTVRVTAEKKNKTVDLFLQGAEVELDRLVLEEMIGPIEHLLRNAVDHGIEGPAARRTLSKPERGAVNVKGFYEGTYVVIEITDDGAGLSLEKIRQTAVRDGYFTEQQAAQSPAAQLFNLIFEPGFSTADGVSDVSGRGVGMDVVRSTVNRLKGEITVNCLAGVGTKFTIRLPMTLAITRVLMMKSHGQLFAIPMAMIHRIFTVEAHQIEMLGSKPVIRIQQRVVPLYRLSEVLNAGRQVEISQQEIPVVILQLGEQQVALTADQLIEAREVVVKTLGDVLKRVNGITGSTLTGDGKVVLILNPMELFGGAADEQSSAVMAAPRRSASRSLDVLIVDDSVSVRRLLSNLISRQGWRPSTAKDGMEALEMLQHAPKKPDVILLDIEMPRMDGYELTTMLRSQEAFSKVPIVMCTSRAGEKHRKKAFQLGATDYLVKPYQDDMLLDSIRKAIREQQEAKVS